MQDLASTQNSTSVIYNINRIIEQNHMVISIDAVKLFVKVQHTFIKNLLE